MKLRRKLAGQGTIILDVSKQQLSLIFRLKPEAVLKVGRFVVMCAHRLWHGSLHEWQPEGIGFVAFEEVTIPLKFLIRQLTAIGGLYKYPSEELGCCSGRFFAASEKVAIQSAMYILYA